jgi:4-carboxymuconolactone decarboxylase
MARVPLLTKKEELPEAQHQEHDEIMSILGNVGGPFGLLLYSPGLALKVCQAGAHVRLESELTMVERELALLATLREKDADFEWGGHSRTARQAGMAEATIDVIKNDADPSGLPDDDRDVILFTRQLLRKNKVEDDVFNRLQERHGTRWVLEIAATIGQYQYISAVNNAFNQEPREGAEVLPHIER